MRWMKIREACAYLGGISADTLLYAATARGAVPRRADRGGAQSALVRRMARRVTPSGSRNADSRTKFPVVQRRSPGSGARDVDARDHQHGYGEASGRSTGAPSDPRRIPAARRRRSEDAGSLRALAARQQPRPARRRVVDATRYVGAATRRRTPLDAPPRRRALRAHSDRRPFLLRAVRARPPAAYRQDVDGPGARRRALRLDGPLFGPAADSRLAECRPVGDLRR